MPELQETPLAQAHRDRGAQFTEFGGWNMPLRFQSDRLEHAAVREMAGLFDLSHMAQIEVEGPGAPEALDSCVCTQPSTMTVGKARYSMILDHDGGILDDLIIYRLAPEHFLVVANASNRLVVRDELTKRCEILGPSLSVVDHTLSRAMIALQGPCSLDKLQEIFSEEDGSIIASMPYYSIRELVYEGTPIRVARTGYTGERGYEIMLPASAGLTFWGRLARIEGIRLCGLAARDTLRLEAGMPLYGHELSRDLSPRDVGMESLIGNHTFVGHQALEHRPQQWALYGLEGEGKRAARAGNLIYQDEEEIGVITSGVLSPTLGYPVALARMKPGIGEGSNVEVDVRGTRLTMLVRAIPFYSRTRKTTEATR